MNSSDISEQIQTLDSVEVHFSAAHFYRQNQWSDSKNASTFGKCFHPQGHGHDYKLQIWFDSNLKSRNEIRQDWREAAAELRDRLDHKHLNHDIEEFKIQVPTTENLAVYICHFLSERSKSLHPKKILLFERADLWVELYTQDRF